MLGIFYIGAASNADAQVTISYSFGSGTPAGGVSPVGGLVQAPDGSFYGTTFAELRNVGANYPSGTVYRFEPTTGKVKFVKSFASSSHSSPQSPLLLFNGGILGVTNGTNKTGGIIFNLSTSGTLQVWYTFGNANSPDGSSPLAPLVLAPNGDIYGTTKFPAGVVYKLNATNHQVQVVTNFLSTGSSFPSFLLAKDGNFYGIADSNAGPVIFMMTPAGVMTTLYTFPDYPANLTLMQASDGTFYGTTEFSDIANKYGTLFKMTGTPPNVTVTTLHVFGQGNDGKNPSGPVAVGPNGNLYGETFGGGTGVYGSFQGAGIIYEITTDGSTYNVLHNFSDGSIPNDGIGPMGGLTLGTDNNFYGATGQGGAYGPTGSFGWGTLFKLSP